MTVVQPLPLFAGATMPPDLRLLCLLLHPRPDSAACADLARGMDWSAWLELARRHRVVPLIAGPLHSLPGLNVPPEILAAITELRGRNARRCLTHAAEAVRLGRILAERGIRVLAVKGVILSQILYDDLTQRQPGDLDLLVDPDCLSRADGVMRELGYASKTAPLDDDRAGLYRRWSKDILYRHDDLRVQVELHHRLSHNPHLLPWDFESLWRDREIVRIGGSEVATLPRRFLSSYLAVHGDVHLYERLLWLTDLAVLAERRELTLPEADPNLAPVLRRAAALAHSWLGAGGTPPLLSPGETRIVRDYAADMAGHRVRAGEEWDLRLFLTRRLYRMGLRKNGAYRWGQIKLELAAQADMDFWVLPPAWHWLYLPLRPVGWLLRRWPEWRGKRR